MKVLRVFFLFALASVCMTGLGQQQNESEKNLHSIAKLCHEIDSLYNRVVELNGKVAQAQAKLDNLKNHSSQSENQNQKQRKSTVVKNTATPDDDVKISDDGDGKFIEQEEGDDSSKRKAPRDSSGNDQLKKKGTEKKDKNDIGTIEK